MSAVRRFLLTNRLAFVIAMVLLLPLAQMTATSHLISHIHAGQIAQVGGNNSTPGLHEDHCGQCLTALAALGGATNKNILSFPAGAIPRENNVADSWVPPTVNFWPSYESRAPPS